MTSNKLWTLWDMLKFHAEKFVELTVLLRSITIFFQDGKENIPEIVRKQIKREMENAITLLTSVGLTQSAKKAKKIAEQTDYEGYDGPHYSVAIDELKERIRDELEDGYFLHLSTDEIKLFAPKTSLFGEQVEKQFPSAIYEIDEAAKCAALGRYTASVFHLMRVLEIGIGAIRQCLGIPDPVKASGRNWGAMLKSFRDNALDVKTKVWRGDDKQFFEEAYASLDAVRVAWRNSTMHVENKYTPDEAEHIFAVVKGFMTKIAFRMDENGQPSA